MGNFEKLSVLVIVVIIVMILVVALYTWSDSPGDEPVAARTVVENTKGDSGRPRSNALEDWEREFGEEPRKDAAKDSGRGTDGDTLEEPRLPDLPPVPDPTPIPDPSPVRDGPEPPPVAQEDWMYTVKKGDTLTEIAERELGTWRRYPEILKRNAGVKAETIREGDTLKMPPKVVANADGARTAADDKGTSAASSTRAGKIVPGEFYVVQRGDRLSRIAKRAYDSIDRWPELWARNLSVISDPDEPPVGAKIFIPK